MSDTGDCVSQEIEASTSSNSTRNSMKYTFVKSILNTENSQIAGSSRRRIIFGRGKVPELPKLEKNDFIQNWIIAHSSIADSPEKSCPGSPILGISAPKRSPQSPILGYQWKRIKREPGSKENCRVSLSKKFQQDEPNPLATARIKIEDEVPRYSEPGIFLCSDKNVDRTVNSANSPVLNKITNSPTLNASRRSRRFGATKSPSNSDADSTLKWHDHKSLDRENTVIPETLSLSSPFCKRNNPFKVVDASNNPKQTIEALNKQLLKHSELLVEETPLDVEIISSSSKIAETLSHSTIVDLCGEVKVDSKRSDFATYDLQPNENVIKFERLQRSPQSSNSMEIEAENSSDNDRRSQGPESSNSSIRLSIPSPFKRKRLIDSKSYNASWIRARTNSVNVKAVETLQGLTHLKKIKESSSIPDTLSVSSQLRASLVFESSHSGIKPTNSPSTEIKNGSVKSEEPGNSHSSRLSKKNWASAHIPDTFSVSSQLPESLVPESSDSRDRLSNRSLLRQKKFIGLNSNDTPWIRPKNSSLKSEVLGSLQGFEQSKKVRESVQIPETVSVSSQMDEILVTESSKLPDLLSLPASLAKNIHVGVPSVNPPIKRLKDSPIEVEVGASANCNKRLIGVGESFKSSTPLSQLIDDESNTTNAPENGLKIESDSDCTISDFIEDPSTQNAFGKFPTPAKSARLEELSQDLEDHISESPQDRTCDSDETYYSNGDSIPRLQITKTSPLKNSQHISQSTSQSHESRVISQVPSPLGNKNCVGPSNVMSRHTTSNNNKKKKCKKGSLVAKLQTIVNSQVSKLRIWRYQMSQPDFTNARTQFVKLKIRERETRYGRHYLTASVIEDPHDLLKSIFESESNLSCEKSGSRFEISIVTLVIIPEIIGVVKIPARSTLKIYPPWEIMDRSRKILNVTFLTVEALEEPDVDKQATIKRENKKVIQEFECPCIRAKTLVDSCRVKYSNTKTSVMQEMFSS